MIKESISKMIQEAIDGNTSCCEVHATLKQIEALTKAGIGAIQSGVIDEAREFVKGESYYNGTWQIKTTATLLDYASDENYLELNSKASARKKALNQAWKAKNEGHGFFDTETGDVVPVLPVKTPGKEIAVWMPAKPKAKENTGDDHKFNFDKS